MPVATQLEYYADQYEIYGRPLPNGWTLYEVPDTGELRLEPAPGFTRPYPMLRPGYPLPVAPAPPPPPGPIGPGTLLPAGAPKFVGNPAEQKLPETEDPNSDCVICTAKLNSRERYVGKCGHTVHSDEYANLAAHPSGNKKCPFCRNQFGGRRRKTKKSRKTRRR
jgi:hypothetical protein